MKTVALIDFSLDGHHLTYLRSFAKNLLEQGNRVCCVVPGCEAVTSWIDQHVTHKKELFHSFEYSFKLIPSLAFGKFNGAINSISRWRYDAALLKQIERDKQVKIDLVFYAWIDNHLSQYMHPFLLDTIFPYKWSGLYFHPYHLRRETKYLLRKASWRDHDAIFLSKNCISVSVLDLGIVEGFSKRIGKPVIHFPDISDDSTPDLKQSLYTQIRYKAQGRIVVGMIGCEKHKGTLTMMRMVRMADTCKYFFVFAGILPQETYNVKQWNEVQKFVADQMENCFFYFQSIPEGPEYNALFCAIDIPFLVYDNFSSSSNRLTKASIFQKLVLASNIYCVGENVEKYDLGKGVKPNDANAALEGLHALTTRLQNKDLPLENWKIFEQINSNEMLYKRFLKVTSLLN